METTTGCFNSQRDKGIKLGMTNAEKIKQMTDEELAEWLCKQFWDDYDQDDVINIIRYNQVRNFLKMETKE